MVDKKIDQEMKKAKQQKHKKGDMTRDNYDTRGNHGYVWSKIKRGSQETSVALVNILNIALTILRQFTEPY